MNIVREDYSRKMCMWYARRLPKQRQSPPPSRQWGPWMDEAHAARHGARFLVHIGIIHYFSATPEQLHCAGDGQLLLVLFGLGRHRLDGAGKEAPTKGLSSRFGRGIGW